MTASNSNKKSKPTVHDIILKGDYVEKGPIGDGTRLWLRGGSLTVEGPVGNNVFIQVEGDITLKGDAGRALHAYAFGKFTAQSVDRDANITAAGGQAEVYKLGENGWLRGKFGVAITAKDAKCGDHKLFYDKNGVTIYRKVDAGSGGPQDSESCKKPESMPRTPRH